MEAARKEEDLELANKAKRDALLKQLRESDLADVIAKCKMHSFTPTDSAWCAENERAGTKVLPEKHQVP